ncbi:calponin homology domain-containing protein, partial [Dichotomocladium elegans]
MGESRMELLAWLNDLLQLNYRKIEQAGTGAAYCQIMDSIYGDVHLTKVKFDTKHEYEYINNYKVLQHTFEKHKIDKIILVDRLVKCKFQDNLEFMQWIKRFWDQNYQGGTYDAVGRRKSGAAKAAAIRSGGSAPPAVARKTAGGGHAGGASGTAGAHSVDNHSAAMIIELNKQISELKLTVDGLEKERDFYFGKLRDIEIIVQEHIDSLEQEHGENAPDIGVFKEIQTILYSTE